MFDLQLFLERLQREADFIGKDAEQLGALLSSLLSRVREGRAAKQDRVVGGDWQRWRELIESIRKNPLDPQTQAECIGGYGREQLATEVDVEDSVGPKALAGDQSV